MCLVRLQGELHAAVTECGSGGHEQVECERVRHCQLGADATALRFCPRAVEVDWVEALVGLDGFSVGLLGLCRRRRRRRAEKSRVRAWRRW
jgi:hypothetical protein